MKTAEKPLRIWAKVLPEKFDNESPTPARLIGEIKNGLPGASLARTADLLNIHRTELYSILHLTPKTAQRASKAVLSIDTSDHLVQLLKVVEKCTETFGTTERASEWLRTPNYALDDEAPLKLMDTIEGINLIHDILIRIDYGVFA